MKAKAIERFGSFEEKVVTVLRTKILRSTPHCFIVSRKICVAIAIFLPAEDRGHFFRLCKFAKTSLVAVGTFSSKRHLNRH